MATEIRKTFTMTEFKNTFEAEAYSTDGGKTWLWASNDRPCPLDACREYSIPCEPAAQEAAQAAYLDRMLAAYRQSQPARPSAQERTEARAAFGPGRQIVDVISGRRFTS